jgi:hypothetical protein
MRRPVQARGTSRLLGVEGVVSQQRNGAGDPKRTCDHPPVEARHQLQPLVAKGCPLADGGTVAPGRCAFAVHLLQEMLRAGSKSRLSWL